MVSPAAQKSLQEGFFEKTVASFCIKAMFGLFKPRNQFRTDGFSVEIKLTFRECVEVTYAERRGALYFPGNWSEKSGNKLIWAFQKTCWRAIRLESLQTSRTHCRN